MALCANNSWIVTCHKLNIKGGAISGGAVGVRLPVMATSHTTPSTGRHRKEFEDFMKTQFLDQKNRGSKVITRSKGDLIISYLARKAGPFDAHFHFWVKGRGFRALDDLL